MRTKNKTASNITLIRLKWEIMRRSGGDYYVSTCMSLCLIRGRSSRKTYTHKKGKESFYEIGFSQSRFFVCIFTFSPSPPRLCKAPDFSFFFFCLQVTYYNHTIEVRIFRFLISFENCFADAKIGIVYYYNTATNWCLSVQNDLISI